MVVLSPLTMAKEEIQCKGISSLYARLLTHVRSVLSNWTDKANTLVRTLGERRCMGWSKLDDVKMQDCCDGGYEYVWFCTTKPCQEKGETGWWSFSNTRVMRLTWRGEIRRNEQFQEFRKCHCLSVSDIDCLKYHPNCSRNTGLHNFEQCQHDCRLFLLWTNCIYLR